ncbi:MAG: hypothetical protein AAB944_00325 [Patescibacteria group bacterium]
MTNNNDRACRKIAEYFFDQETLDLVGRVLALEDDKRVSSVELELHRGAYGNISDVEAGVKLTKTFDNQQEFRDYLRKHNLPIQDAYQYCQNSHAFEYKNKREQTVHVHFSQPDYKY